MWSAGCATGEETYSLAFVAQWFKTRHPDAVFQLTGTDINPHNIEHAGQATYRARSFRKCSKEFQQEFAYSLGREVRDEFKVDSRLQKVVQFRILNLRDLPGLKCLSGLDIILCRNVLIYFEDRFRQDLIRTFHGLLKPGGMLFLGETESLPHMPDLFRLVNCHGAYGYARVDEPENAA
jgi:chemotaxis protein methyltransferase CheR